MTETVSASPATAGEGWVITDEDGETLQRIIRAYESSFVEWYVAQHMPNITDYQRQRYPNETPDERAARFRKYATDRMSFDHIDEEGRGVFSDWNCDDTHYMPFDAIVGSSAGQVERYREEVRLAHEQLMREREERLEKERLEAERKKAAEAREEQRRRDRIFREEAAKRGIEVPK